MQHSSWTRALTALAVAWLLLGAAFGCSRVSPEQAVRQQLDALQSAIDARDARAVQGLLAEDFIGNDGIDRRGARQLAVAAFLQHGEIHVRLGPVKVTLRGKTEATAQFSVLATGGNGGLLPESGQVFDVETGWRLANGKWQLLNAHWSPEL